MEEKTGNAESPRPFLLTEPCTPPSFPRVCWTPEMRPGLWVSGPCPAAWRGLLGLPIEIAQIIPFPEQDILLVISHQTPSILQQKPQSDSVTAHPASLSSRMPVSVARR